MIEDEVGFRWMRVRPCLLWIFQEEAIADEDPLRREITEEAVRVFNEDRPKLAPSARMFTPEKEACETYDHHAGKDAPFSGRLFNLHGFVFFIRCLKSFTAKYTIVDQLYANATTLARALFSPTLKDLEACLRLPANPGAFAPSLPPRAAAPRPPPQTHPYARPPPVPASVARAPAAASSVRPRVPTLLETFRSKATPIEQQEAFTLLQPAVLRLLQSVPVPAASGRSADRTSDDKLAQRIICCLPDFVPALAGAPTAARTQRAKVRELLNDLALNPTLIPALRGGRLTPQELMKVQRAKPLRATH